MIQIFKYISFIKILLIILLTIFLLFSFWEILVYLTDVPKYILPPPTDVLFELIDKFGIILKHLKITFLEIILGIFLGTILGCIAALTVFIFKPARMWLLPVLVASQAIPVFAIAPLLVLWLGYGISSKIAMAVLIIFFPVTANFLDGLRQTKRDLIDIAKVMSYQNKYSTLMLLRYIQIPSAIPNLGSGIRVAAAVAPIGAIVGEWVGSGAGLGYLMLQSNAKFQIDLMFASLLVIIFISVIIYFVIDIFIKILIKW